jgi:hypothetical protein
VSDLKKVNIEILTAVINISLPTKCTFIKQNQYEVFLKSSKRPLEEPYIGFLINMHLVGSEILVSENARCT